MLLKTPLNQILQQFKHNVQYIQLTKHNVQIQKIMHDLQHFKASKFHIYNNQNIVYNKN